MGLHIKKPLVIHPYLFAVIPIIFLYTHNIDQTSFSSTILPMIVSLCFTVALIQLLKIILGDITKSGLIVSIILILFFIHGHLHSLLLDWIAKNFLHRASWDKINLLGKIDILLHLTLFVIWFIIAKRLIKIILKKDTFSVATKFLNVFSVFMILYSFFNIGLYNYERITHQNSNPYYKPTSFEHPEETPDIYYIILDGYAREDILREFYNFDNSYFLDYLENKGFYIAPRSNSNYAWTFLSLPSSLNFKYINYLADDVGIDSNDLRIPYEMIKNNHASQFLKEKGYLFVHFNSTWGATLSNKYADIEIGNEKGFFQDEYLRILVQTTALKFFDSIIIEDLAKSHLYTLKMLETIPELEAPTFTFVHLVLPHHPYLFDRNGNVIHHATLLNQFQAHMWANKNEYIEQLIFVNNRMKGVIDTLLRKSSPPPIIIIQSDHGPQVPGVDNETFIRARMAILNAYYLPDKNHILYDSITPVNTFRLIFNYYFNEPLPLLNDKSYFSTFSKPYALRLVSCSNKPGVDIDLNNCSENISQTNDRREQEKIMGRDLRFLEKRGKRR
jgi:hypothetical protein